MATRGLIPMRVVLLGAATLLMSACSANRVCPMYRTVGGIGFDATAYVATHPTAAKLCLDHTDPARTPGPTVTAPPAGSCQPIDRVTIGADSAGKERFDLTITTASGTVLLHATPNVRVRYVDPDPGCGNGSYRGGVTIAADGSVTST